MDIYRPIKIAGFFNILAMVQVVALGSSRRIADIPTPLYNVVDFQCEFSSAQDQLTIDQVAQQKGWNESRMFVSPAGANEIERQAELRKWQAYGWMFVAIGATIGIWLLGGLVLRDWRAGVAISILAPAISIFRSGMPIIG